MSENSSNNKRPTNVIANAVFVMRLATGEIEEQPEVDDGKDKAAVSLGRKGGKARAAKMTPERRKEIARLAAEKRWGKNKIILDQANKA